MKSISVMVFLIIYIVLFIIDLYTYRGLRSIFSNFQYNYIIYILHWLVYVVIVLGSFYVYLNQQHLFTSNLYYGFVYPITGLLIAVYVPKMLYCVFLLIGDAIRLFNLIFNSALLQNISKFWFLGGAIISLALMLFIFYGIAHGRFHYKIKPVKLKFNHLPAAFNNYRIVQISDWHIGSFIKYPHQVKKSVELINKQNADLIVFTGDIVNNLATELEPFTQMLKQLKASHGKYAILGNHDYGEYVNWKTKSDEHKNLLRLEKLIAESGFILLKNRNITLTKQNDSIHLIGVENWGLPPFPQNGDLKKSLNGLQNGSFKILLSHDPSHWKEIVVPNSTIDLTLSGHTHGMQFGVDLPGFKWSPVKWRYPEWSGLYKQGTQYLYVNQGIGFIGFPGRVGIRPEITVIQLVSE